MNGTELPTGAERPPVLLAMGDYPPTLAAMRCLGRAGVRVTLAEWRHLVPARWSRHANRVVACPDLNARPDDYLAWLLEFGAREPGHVLLATSDDLAWLYAANREALSRHFRVGVPPVAAIYRLLNKVQLDQACRDVGIEVPRSWFAERRADLERLAADVQYPVVVKPQTQVFLWPHQKGRVVRSAAALPRLYDEFVAATHHAAAVVAHDPGVSRPLLQAFEEKASAGIYNLAGFIGPDDASLVLASRKVLQRPRLLGVGLCFEEAEVRPDLAASLVALLRSVGYRGVFEVEFLEAGDRRLLIDVNPRFYGEMGFEIARGAPLPWLAYLDAIGDLATLRAAVALARQATSTTRGRVYRHRIQIAIFFTLLRLVGRMDRAEHGRWGAWFGARRHLTSDALLDREDPWPGVLDVVTSLYANLRHPRATWRQAREA